MKTLKTYSVVSLLKSELIEFYEQGLKKNRANFYSDFLAFPVGKYYLNVEKNYVFYRFKFWEVLEVRFWLKTGKISIVENENNFTKI